MDRIKQAVLLTGGLAKRLGPLTEVTNKHLLPVYDKPMLYHGLELLRDLGIESVTVILGGNSVGDIVNLIKDGTDFGMHITYVFQRYPSGISQAILLAEKTLQQSKFLVLLGDNVFDTVDASMRESVDFFFKETYPFTEGLVFLKESDNPHNYGQPVYNGYGDIVGFVEKSPTPKHNDIVIGLYGFNYDVFDIIRAQVPSNRGELEITDTLNKYIGYIDFNRYTGFWTDCGTPEGLSLASEYFRRRVENVKDS